MSLRITLAAGIAALSIASPAFAADPESGEVSPTKPTVTWTGTVTEPTGGYELAVIANEGTQGTCEQPHCDTFALKVAAGASALTVRAAGSEDDTFSMTFEVEDPEGKVTLVSGDDSVPEREATFDNPAAGDWIVRVLGTPQLESFSYEGTATLTVPAAAGPAPGSGTTPPAGGTPPPSSPPAPPAAPPQQQQQQPAPGSPPVSAPAPKLTVRALSRRARTAKRLRKGRRFAASVATTAPLTRVTAVLVPARRRTQVVASGRTARIAKTGSVRLKLRRAARRGRYLLIVAGIDSSGRRVIAQRTVSVR